MKRTKLPSSPLALWYQSYCENSASNAWSTVIREAVSTQGVERDLCEAVTCGEVAIGLEDNFPSLITACHVPNEESRVEASEETREQVFCG